MDFKKVSTQILEPDRKLAAIVGDTPRTRGEIIRKFWDYINERGLQDTDRRMINADKDLQLVLGGKKQVNIFQVATLVSKHLKKPKPKKTAEKKPKKVARKPAAEKAPKPAKTVNKPEPVKSKEEEVVSKKPEAEKSEAGNVAPQEEAGEKKQAEKAATEATGKTPAPEVQAPEAPAPEAPAPEAPAPEKEPGQ